MQNIDILEKERLRIQRRLDSQKTQSKKNRLGQFATPSPLAREIVNYILEEDFFKNQSICFLDPAIGTGSFFSALISIIPKEKIENAMGVEIDNELAKIAEELWGNHSLKVINKDFTRLELSKEHNKLTNLILTNPPYVRHHHISRNDKIRLQNLVREKLGYRINGLAGLYCYFLLLSHSWLRNNGYGVWLIPSEFMDVNYGRVIKKYLTEKVTLIHIHRFNPEEVQFDNALVSSVIVVYQKKKPNKDNMIRFSYGGSLQHPQSSQLISIEELKRCRKWTNLSKKTSFARLKAGDKSFTLSVFFKIQRGIATGANGFFMLPRTRAKSLGIPDEFLKPILPSPRNLKIDVIESDNDGYPAIKEQLVVIDCNLPEDIIQKNYTRFWDYLKRGEKNGVKDRYLVRKRSPWYKQEHRKPAPFLCTYMGRSSNGNKPFRFIWNKSNAISTNVYLLLYPINKMAEILNENPDIYIKVFETLKQIAVEEIIDSGRVYGGGLHKVEPKELGRLSGKMFVELFQSLGYALYRQQKLSTYA